MIKLYPAVYSRPTHLDSFFKKEEIPAAFIQLGARVRDVHFKDQSWHGVKYNHAMTIYYNNRQWWVREALADGVKVNRLREMYTPEDRITLLLPIDEFDEELVDNYITETAGYGWGVRHAYQPAIPYDYWNTCFWQPINHITDRWVGPSNRKGKRNCSHDCAEGINYCAGYNMIKTPWDKTPDDLADNVRFNHIPIQEANIWKK